MKVSDHKLKRLKSKSFIKHSRSFKLFRLKATNKSQTYYSIQNSIVDPISVYVCASNRTSFLVILRVNPVRTYTRLLIKMPSTPIESCNKYVLSYKDSSNNTQQIGIYARDSYDCLMIARSFNSYVHDHPNSVVRIQQKFWGNQLWT